MMVLSTCATSHPSSEKPWDLIERQDVMNKLHNLFPLFPCMDPIF